MRTTIAEYAGVGMQTIWSSGFRVQIERVLWTAIMRHQSDLGLNIPEEAIESYEKVIGTADLNRIAEIEQTTKHDLRARLQHFNEQAGYNYAHWGLTSCDITDNATQVQVQQSLEQIRTKTMQVLDLLAGHIHATRDVVCVARTHNQPAQPTLLGKRLATVADEILVADGAVLTALFSQASRGLAGAVGTMSDLETLLGPEGAIELNKTLISELGFNAFYWSTGQVYHRSDDLAWVSALKQVCAGPANLARLVRLESGFGRMWESFYDGQIGSSAMPHKRNPVISERVCGLQTVVDGYAMMLETGSRQQWYEGDVSDSVTRRVALPGLFMAVDAVLGNTIQLLAGLDLSKELYQEDLANSWEVLKSGELLNVAIAAGADRDETYRVLQEWNYLSTGKLPVLPPLSADAVDSVLEADPPLKVARVQIDSVLKLIEEMIGNAKWETEGDLRSAEN